MSVYECVFVCMCVHARKEEQKKKKRRQIKGPTHGRKKPKKQRNIYTRHCHTEWTLSIADGILVEFLEYS